MRFAEGLAPTAGGITVDPPTRMGEHVSMKPYSEDLRTRIVKAIEEGMSKSGAARLFGVSLSSVKRYTRIAGADWKGWLEY